MNKNVSINSTLTILDNIEKDVFDYFDQKSEFFHVNKKLFVLAHGISISVFLMYQRYILWVLTLLFLIKYWENLPQVVQVVCVISFLSQIGDPILLFTLIIIGKLSGPNQNLFEEDRKASGPTPSRFSCLVTSLRRSVSS